MVFALSVRVVFSLFVVSFFRILVPAFADDGVTFSASRNSEVNEKEEGHWFYFLLAFILLSAS